MNYEAQKLSDARAAMGIHPKPTREAIGVGCIGVLLSLSLSSIFMTWSIGKIWHWFFADVAHTEPPFVKVYAGILIARVLLTDTVHPTPKADPSVTRTINDNPWTFVARAFGRSLLSPVVAVLLAYAAHLVTR